VKEIIVGTNEAGQRLDKLVIKYIPVAAKGFVYKMIRKKNITLNDRKCEGNEILNKGDSVKLWLSDETINKFQNNNEPDIVDKNLEIIYEDEDILIYNKPAGLLSQKADPADISVNEILISYLLKSSRIDIEQLKTFKPSVCNRLDRNTSGLIVCGKTLNGLQSMSEVIRNRSAHKDYVAVVKGRLTVGAELKGYLTKDNKTNTVSVGNEGDYIETLFKPIWTDGNRTWIIVRLVTGKTHQIRAHLASIGHPIIGDMKYGDGKGAKRQLLHAYRLTLPDGRIFTANFPEDMKWEHGKPGAFEDLPWKIS